MRGLNLPRREPKFKHNSVESEGNFIIVLIINSLINPRKGNIIFFTVYMQAQTQFQMRQLKFIARELNLKLDLPIVERKFTKGI